MGPETLKLQKQKDIRNVKARAKRAQMKAERLANQGEPGGKRKHTQAVVRQSTEADVMDITSDSEDSGGDHPAITKKVKMVPRIVTVYIHVEPPASTAHRGSKTTKQQSLKAIQKGPFFHNISHDFSTFKELLAKTMPCKVKLMAVAQMEWKYEKPLNDKKKPISDEAGYKAMTISLEDRKKDLIIFVSMPPPVKDDVVSCFAHQSLYLLYASSLGIQARMIML
jgi:hypothetical protein